MSASRFALLDADALIGRPLKLTDTDWATQIDNPPPFEQGSTILAHDEQVQKAAAPMFAAVVAAVTSLVPAGHVY